MSPEDLRRVLPGVNAVTITPFTDDLDLDEASLRHIVRHLDDGGADTIITCGGTAEYYALTAAERSRINTVALDEARHRPVIVSVGLGAAEASTAVAEAERAGAAGIMIHQPIHPYTSADGLFDYYRQICGATSLGVVVYLRDPRVTTDLIARLIKLDNVVGIKYAINDVRRFGSTVKELEGLSDVVWLCGTAEAWAPYFWLAGAQGFTSGLANFAVHEAIGLRDALRSGDAGEIRRLWRRLLPLEDLRSRHADANNISVLKSAAHMCGLSATEAIRPPLQPLDAEDRRELVQLLAAWGIVEGHTAP
jgi:Dihydrodipicolinate synthase/N-acetylneuraminate lyase